MKRILTYDSDDENEKKVIKKEEKPNGEVKIEPTIPEKTEISSKKLKKFEIYQKLGLKNKIENESDEEEEEDLSSQIQEKKEEVLKIEKLVYKPKQFNPLKLEKPEALIDTPAMKEGSDFMKKFEKVVKGEKTESEISLEKNEINYEIEEIQKTKERREEEEEFELDPNVYGEEDFEEIIEETEVEMTKVSSKNSQKISNQKPKNLEEMNLPDDIKRDIHLNGRNIIDVSLDNPEQDEIIKRQQKERFKKSIQPKPQEKVFNDIQKSKSQLSYLAHQSKITENERLEKKAQGEERKKKSWGQYGW